MRSPFPGVDPFIEDQGFWRDFHARFLNYCSEFLSDVLPDGYDAQIEERFYLIDALDERGKQYLPDVSILREGPFPSAPSAHAGVLTLEPVTIPHQERATEEVGERWLEIRSQPDREIITAIELLSPTNKGPRGQGKYSEKRVDLMRRGIHLTEFDLLLGGQRLPMARPLPDGDYFALVTRAERHPECDVYAWTIRQPLPSFPIPLKAPDPDIFLDLAAVFAAAYEGGRYSRKIRYGEPLRISMKPKDHIWAEEVAKASVRNP